MLLALTFSVSAFAQPDDENDLLSLLGEEETTDYATATFKGTRVINMHSIENVAAGVLDFRISHRFGFINTGAYEFFGLDGATLRLGFEYGITDRLMVGIGRSSNNKAFDAFGKFKILRQSSGKKNVPITLSVFSSVVCNTIKWQDPDRQNYFSSRLSYSHQILIGRKFNDNFSLQVTPTLVHRNLVETAAEKNDVYALGIGGRHKLTKRTSINAEYFYVMPNQLADKYTNSLSVGFDIETGGHVFQLHFTNSTGMVEPTFVTETVGEWLKGDIHFGFNVSRVFTVKERKEPVEQ
ncbi:MAG: DUF5777 family beta-barrel protein [Flavobacteriales bacterium]|jgi:Membrane bound beta barrel domain (DUF5777)